MILILIAFITFVMNNGVLEANIMEARNLTTAREMLEKNNWFEPTMNGELRLEKPPLPTWITAGTMYLFGDDNLSLLRLPAALAALLLVFFLFCLTAELTEDHLLPFLSAGTAATSFYIFFMSRDISWDIFCHSFMIGSICLIHKGLKSKGMGWPELAGAAMLMVFSFMSKGPVAFYALLLPYLIARSVTFGWEGWSDKKGAIFTMGVVTLLICLLWPLHIWISHPGFSEMIARQESTAWLERSTRPVYHYWSFPVQSGIWTIFGVVALAFPYAKGRINRFGNYNFLFVWVVSAVLLLSLIPEKKERYLLPVLLPLAMITAFYFRYLTDVFSRSAAGKPDLIIFRVNTLLMAFLSLAIPVVLLAFTLGKGNMAFHSLLFIFILFWGLAALFIAAFRKGKPLWLWMGMVGMVMAVCVLLIPLAPGFAITNPNYRSYKELRQRPDLQGVPFFYNGEIPGKFIEVIWNSGHAVRSWDPAKNQKLPATPPLLFLSDENPALVLPPEILNSYHIELLGRFDGNMGKRGGNNVLSNYATVIREN